jgi:hypothetical protein
VAGSSPRKPGSLLVHGKALLLRFTPLNCNSWHSNPFALEARSSPRKPGSLLVQ